MESEKYLDEAKYQKNKKKITILAIIVLIIGLSLGGGLITMGIIKTQNAKLSAEDKNQIQLEIDDFNSQLSSLKAQQHQEVTSNGLSETYYNIGNEIDKIEDKIDELEDRLDNNNPYYAVFYVFGAFTIILTFGIFATIYTTAKGREINAYYAQQQIPIAKEGIDVMAPTIGNAAGEIAKSIKRGITDGNEDK